MGFGRMLVSEAGNRKSNLESGQQKSVKSDHIILVPGPRSEIYVARRIFKSFVVEKKTRTAAELNADGIRNARGKPWSILTISNILKNEAYTFSSSRSFSLRPGRLHLPKRDDWQGGISFI